MLGLALGFIFIIVVFTMALVGFVWVICTLAINTYDFVEDLYNYYIPNYLNKRRRKKK